MADHHVLRLILAHRCSSQARQTSGTLQSRHARVHAKARTVLGAGPFLAPGYKVLLETDPERARAI